MDIHKIMPTVRTITGLPAQLDPSAPHSLLTDAYNRPDADYFTAQQEGHTAASVFLSPEGAQPLPEF